MVDMINVIDELFFFLLKLNYARSSLQAETMHLLA